MPGSAPRLERGRGGRGAASAPATSAPVVERPSAVRGGVLDPQVGDEAPGFELPSSRGGRIGLTEFRGRKNVLLIFYPKDESLVCTRQLCSYAEAYRRFEEKGYEILGVNPDPVDRHKRFAQGRRLPFPLLSDETGEVCAAYGVAGRLVPFPKRAIFLVDKEGIVRYRHVEPTRLLYRKADAILEVLERTAAA